MVEDCFGIRSGRRSFQGRFEQRTESSNDDLFFLFFIGFSCHFSCVRYSEIVVIVGVRECIFRVVVFSTCYG